MKPNPPACFSGSHAFIPGASQVGSQTWHGGGVAGVLAPNPLRTQPVGSAAAMPAGRFGSPGLHEALPQTVACQPPRLDIVQAQVRSF